YGVAISSTFAYATPNISGATLALTAGASKEDGSGAMIEKVGIADQGEWVLEIPAFPELVSPLDQTREVGRATRVTWRAPRPGLCLLHISQERTDYLIATSASELTLADLSSLGIALRPNTQYLWRLWFIPDFSDVDQAAGPSGMAGSWSSSRQYPTADSLI